MLAITNLVRVYEMVSLIECLEGSRTYRLVSVVGILLACQGIAMKIREHRMVIYQ